MRERSERRKLPRVATPLLIEFPHPETAQRERSFTQDITEAGMRFPTRVKLQIGQGLPLSLTLTGRPATLRTMGEVIWLREIARHGAAQYEVGVRFQWIDDPDRQQLAQHLGATFPQPP